MQSSHPCKGLGRGRPPLQATWPPLQRAWLWVATPVGSKPADGGGNNNDRGGSKVRLERKQRGLQPWIFARVEEEEAGEQRGSNEVRRAAESDEDEEAREQHGPLSKGVLRGRGSKGATGSDEEEEAGKEKGGWAATMAWEETTVTTTRATVGEMGKSNMAEAIQLGTVSDRWALKRREGR
ncbi:hypothetical protein BHE74_00007436 [Ensete ventricosum]|nr:hypothetical protein BHE74_00007436 [Ensete ventricosum]